MGQKTDVAETGVHYPGLPDWRNALKQQISYAQRIH